MDCSPARHVVSVPPYRYMESALTILRRMSQWSRRSPCTGMLMVHKVLPLFPSTWPCPRLLCALAKPHPAKP